MHQSLHVPLGQPPQSRVTGNLTNSLARPLVRFTGLERYPQSGGRLGQVVISGRGCLSECERDQHVRGDCPRPISSQARVHHRC